MAPLLSVCQGFWLQINSCPGAHWLLDTQEEEIVDRIAIYPNFVGSTMHLRPKNYFFTRFELCGSVEARNSFP